MDDTWIRGLKLGLILEKNNSLETKSIILSSYFNTDLYDKVKNLVKDKNLTKEFEYFKKTYKKVEKIAILKETELYISFNIEYSAFDVPLFLRYLEEDKDFVNYIEEDKHKLLLYNNIVHIDYIPSIIHVENPLLIYLRVGEKSVNYVTRLFVKALDMVQKYDGLVACSVLSRTLFGKQMYLFAKHENPSRIISYEYIKRNL